MTTVSNIQIEQPLLEDDGNVLIPLMRIRDKYLNRAQKLIPLTRRSDNPVSSRTIAFYQDAAEAVDRLIIIGNCKRLVDKPLEM